MAYTLFPLECKGIIELYRDIEYDIVSQSMSFLRKRTMFLLIWVTWESLVLETYPYHSVSIMLVNSVLSHMDSFTTMWSCSEHSNMRKPVFKSPLQFQTRKMAQNGSKIHWIYMNSPISVHIPETCFRFYLKLTGLAQLSAPRCMSVRQ